MSEDKTSREPPKKPWWIRVAIFVSNLLKTQDELIREQEIEQLNVYGNDSQVISRLPKDIEKPEYQEYLIERLARGSGNIRVGLMKHLVEMEKILDDNKIPLDAEKILQNLNIIINQVSSKSKDKSEWNLGDEHVIGSWERWRQDMQEKINRISGKINDVIKYNLGERVDVNLSVLSTPVNKEVEKEKLFAFIEKVLPVDDNYREQLKTQLASGRDDLVLNIPKYLTQEMKKLQNGEVTEGLPERLVKIKTLLDEVKKENENKPKGKDWKIAEIDVDETKSFSSWFTAMDNTITLLNGMIAKIQSPEQTVAVTQVSDRGAPVNEGRVRETEPVAQPNPPQEEVSAEASDGPETPTRPAQGVPSTKKPLTPLKFNPNPAVSRGKVENPTQGETGDSARAKDEQVTQQPMRARTQARPKAPPTQSGDTSAERVVPAPVPAKSETEEPGSTTEPVAAPRESRRPIQRPLGARPLPQINTATGAVENQDATAKKSQPVSGATQDKTAGSETAEAEQITKQPTTLPRPSRRPLPTPGQGSQTPRNSTKEVPGSISAQSEGSAPLPRPSGRPLPTPGQESQAPRTSTRELPGRVSARTKGATPLSGPSTRAPTPVRRKPPGTGEGQSTPLRESQRDNLPSTSQGAPQEIKPRSEPPKPLPRNTQGPAQGGNKQPGTPAPTPRKSQGDSLGGQARNLKSEHDKRLGSSPDKSVTRKGKDEPPPIPPRDKRNP